MNLAHLREPLDGPLPIELTKLLAVYGAFLSTVVFIWNVLRARPRARVKIILGVEEIDGKFVHGAYISVQNPSSAPVHISSISVLYPYRTTGLKDALEHLLRFRRLPTRLGWVHSALHYRGVKDGCPVSIDPGKAHQVFLPEQVIEEMLNDSVKRELIAVAQDQLWNDTYSSTLSFPRSKQ